MEEPSLINFTPTTPEITQALVVSEEGELLENTLGSPDPEEEN
jgi:hypothetical protein